MPTVAVWVPCWWLAGRTGRLAHALGTPARAFPSMFAPICLFSATWIARYAPELAVFFGATH